jgi:hypothetical protein
MCWSQEATVGTSTSTPLPQPQPSFYQPLANHVPASPQYNRPVAFVFIRERTQLGSCVPADDDIVLRSDDGIYKAVVAGPGW